MLFIDIQIFRAALEWTDLTGRRVSRQDCSAGSFASVVVLGSQDMVAPDGYPTGVEKNIGKMPSHKPKTCFFFLCFQYFPMVASHVPLAEAWWLGVVLPGAWCSSMAGIKQNGSIRVDLEIN